MEEKNSVGAILKEALLPANVDFLGIGVNPSFYSALIVTGVVILLAVIFRVFIFPRFKTVPGKFQIIIETIVGYFEKLANGNSRYGNALGAYVFSTGVYIFIGTLIELVGLRPVFADINGCIAMGVTAFLFLLSGGVRRNKLRGVGLTLKEFSMPVSMSFRLFGALLSGVLATELIYSGFAVLSYTVVLPVFVAVLFTLLHAVMQTYIYTMLTAMFYGEVTEPSHKTKKVKNKKGAQASTEV